MPSSFSRASTLLLRMAARSRRILVGALLATLTTGLASCNATGTPSFEFVDKQGDLRRNPTVDDVMDHVACELQTALYARQPVLFGTNPPAFRARAEMASIPNRDRRQRLYSAIDGSEKAIRTYGYAEKAQNTPSREEALWNNLIRDNFVATVSLSVQVTNSEGINPSLSFITPSPPYPIPGGNFNSGSLSVAVNGQFDGTQDRIFTVNYLIDISKLWDVEIENCDSLPPSARGPSVGRGLGIRGDLRLSEILDAGLEALDRTKAYNIYAVPTDAEAAAPGSSASAGRRSTAATIAGAPVTAGASAGTQSAKSLGPNTSSGDSSFHAQVDFTINLGANGGPSWVMRHFTGPGGGGGGGGAKGAGGGGASQGFLAANRTATDTLVMQIGATCYKDPGAKPNPDPSSYWEAVNPCSGDSGAQRVGAIRDQMVTVHLPPLIMPV